MARILVIENDPALAGALERCLQNEGHTVNVATMNGVGLRAIERVCPDLVILDLTAAEMNGIGVCRRLRAQTRVPIVALVPKSRGVDELVDNEVPVDDYLTAPFRRQELTARVQAALRRGPTQVRGYIEAIKVDELRINARTRLVSKGGEPVKMTPKEFDLLYFLATNPGQVYSREQLLYNVWEYGSWADPNTITIHIRRLRLKVERNPARPRYLKTVWGAGYTFQP